MTWPFDLFSGIVHKTVKPNCVPLQLCIGAAWVYQEKKDVRFPVKEIRPGVDHIQTQVWDNDRWRFSVMIDGIVRFGKEEYPEIKPYKTLDWLTFLDERVQAEKKRVNRF